MIRNRRNIFIVIGLCIALSGGAWVWAAQSVAHPPATAKVPLSTAAVIRTSLSSTTQFSGTLGYLNDYPVLAQGSGGTVTSLPVPGQTVVAGHPIYEVDGSPVILMYGERPAWRSFGIGMSAGPDVRQLEQNLVALGYATPSSLTVDDSFTWATRAAVRKWQVATNQVVTGTLPLGSVTFEPGPARIQSLTMALGALAQPGAPVLVAASTTPSVLVPVPAEQAYLVHAGDKVTVTLPDGKTTNGEVETISSAAQEAGSGESSANSNAPQATVPALVTLLDKSGSGGFDHAPVTVTVVDKTVTNVLAIPVIALVALAGGGYGVYVDAGGRRQLVGVTPGLFASTLVQVTSIGLTVGDRVEVPAQ